MTAKTTTRGGFGPGTFVDTEYSPLPAECRRLLHHFAEVSPGFTTDDSALESVEFYGGDLPIIPGPLKSQAMVSTAGLKHASFIFAQETY